MNFDDFYGLDRQITLLKGDMNGRHVHAYLFDGPVGMGKRTLAGICARALNCSGTDKPCDACPSCVRALHGAHPDIITLKPEKSIGVEEIRALIARVMTRPFEGGIHAVIMEDAHKMTPAAQNALLKTLEDPPESAVFFLVATSVSPLLPTILSRVRRVRFEGIDGQSCLNALARRGVAPERARILARVADGSVGKALMLDADGQYWAARKRVTDALGALRGASSVGVAAYALRDDKDHSALVFEILEQISRELMRREAVPEYDIAPDIGGLKLRGDALLLSLIRARKRLNSNVAWQSVLEMLLFDILEG